MFHFVAKIELSLGWVTSKQNLTLLRGLSSSLPFGVLLQTTVKHSIVFDGVGLHSGSAARLVVEPAQAGHGIVFRRADNARDVADIPALWNLVNQSPLCTRLQNEHGVSVSTVEHIMAALMGCGVHNAVLTVDGPEVPILDGSSVSFVRGILACGLDVLEAPVWALRVLKPVDVKRGDAWARISPAEMLLIEFDISFSDAAIGTQKKRLNMSNGSFVRELSDSRTFCRKADIDHMRANGLARGGTLENAVVVDGEKVLSPGGLRHSDEAVRHKMLDALGDLALAGAPLLGHYQGSRAGHALTNDLLHALFDTPGALEWVECDTQLAAKLPGAGVHWGEIPQVA